MGRVPAVALMTIAFLLAAAAPGHARGHGGHGHHRFSHHGFHGHAVIVAGPAFWWGPPYPYWWDYAPPYYVYAPPPVVVDQPPVYIQQPPPAPPAAPAYWYYCRSARGYYPSVPACQEPWVRVPARPE